MVVVPGGDHTIGSPEQGEGQQAETGDVYPAGRRKASGLDKEAPAHGAAGTACDGPLSDQPGPVGSGGGSGAGRAEFNPAPGTYEAKGSGKPTASRAACRWIR